MDPLGRGALSIAIDAENLEMVELLVVLGVETKDSLLQSINVGFVEAVELLLEHEELIHKDGEPYVRILGLIYFILIFFVFPQNIHIVYILRGSSSFYLMQQ